MWVIVIVVLVIGLALLYRFAWTGTTGSSELEPAITEQGAVHPDPMSARRPPGEGGLDNLRQALKAKSIEDLEYMLEMGATLRAGAEQLIERELERRRRERNGKSGREH